MRISDWSSDVCSSDLCQRLSRQQDAIESVHEQESAQPLASLALVHSPPAEHHGRHGVARQTLCLVCREAVPLEAGGAQAVVAAQRSEEHTSELQSLMRISYAVFCLKHKPHHHQ